MIEDYSDKNLENISIDNLNLSNRTRNCLIRENLLSIEDVLDLTIEKMKKIRNMGNKSIEEILEFQNYFFEN